MTVERCSNYNRCNIPRALFSRADELKRQYTGAICGLQEVQTKARNLIKE